MSVTTGAPSGKAVQVFAGLMLMIALVPFVIAAQEGLTRSVPGFADVRELGATFSVYSYGQAPYNRSAPFLRFEERVRFSDGAEAFTVRRAPRAAFPTGITPTASANAASCESCHFKDGRGRAHAVGLDLTGFAVVNHEGDGAPAVFRNPAAADAGAARLTQVRWAVAEVIELSGGEAVELVRPVALVDGVEHPLDLRNAPGVYGLGLLEAVPDADIVAHARSRAYGRFGVAGVVPMPTGADDPTRVGRFGWKATFATLSDQVRHALTAELGIVDPGLAEGTGQEDPDFARLATHLTDYLSLLAVPARRLEGPGAHRHGAKLFVETGCAMCHVPSWRTEDTADLPKKYRGLTIYPFTDMLLHDMGEGLRDPTGGELGRHWRTAALWGIGVQLGVSHQAGFLHDGRARTVTEAILWHGGEAAYAVERFVALKPQARADLVAFLSSL